MNTIDQEKSEREDQSNWTCPGCGTGISGDVSDMIAYGLCVLCTRQDLTDDELQAVFEQYD